MSILHDEKPWAGSLGFAPQPKSVEAINAAAEEARLLASRLIEERRQYIAPRGVRQLFFAANGMPQKISYGQAAIRFRMLWRMEGVGRRETIEDFRNRVRQYRIKK